MIGSIEITNGGQLLPTKGRLVLTIDNQFGRDGADVSFFIYNFIDRPMTSAKFGIGNSQGYISLRPFYSTSPFITKDLLITYDFGDSKNVNNMIIKFSDVFALRTNYPLIYSDPVGFPLNTWIRLKTNVVVPLNVNMAVEPEPGRFGGRAYSDPLPFLKLGPKFALSLSKLTIGNNGRALPSRGFVQIGIDGINNPDGSVAFFYRYDFSSTSSQKNLNNVLGDIVYSLLQNNGNKRLVVYYSYVDFFDVANMSLNIGSIFGQNLI
jgi:hypothetical protein